MENDDFDFNRVCRSCKNETTDLRLIFEADESVAESPRLDEMLMACASIQVTLADNLPKSICETCIGQLRNAFCFKLQCEENDLIFRGLAKNTQHSDFTNHMEESHSPFNQTNMGKQSNGVKSGAEYLENHLKRYKTGKIHICDVCNKRFSRLDTLRAHKNKMHTPPTLDTQDIEQLYNMNDDSECEESITVTPDLHSDIYGEDLKEMIEEKAKINEKFEEDINGEIEARNCDRVVVNDSDNVHMTKPMDLKKSRGRPRKNPVKIPSGRPRGRPPTKANVETEEEGVYACPQCNTIFHKMSLLEKHAQTHEGLNLFECDMCDKKFARADQLKHHKFSHLKPFVCEICTKGFKRRDYFQQHVETHSRVLEGFRCENCSRVFKRAEYLAKHMAAEHFSDVLWQHSIATGTACEKL